jgi:DNA-directed RNA polymerase specialized sigma24 family protein
VNSESEFSEPSSRMTSLSLLDAAKQRDQRAWQRLASLYEPLIQEWCRQSQIPLSDIPDITQEVLAAVWKHLE